MGCWTTTTSLPANVYANAATGTYDDALSLGGGDAVGTCYKWTGGTSWSATSSINIARNGMCAAGITGSALIFGGNTNWSSGYQTITEKFTGTTWTTTGSLNTGRAYFGRLTSSNPINGGVMAVAGANAVNNEYWNGSTWSITSNLVSASSQPASSGDMNGGMTVHVGAEKWNGTSWSTTASATPRFRHGVSGVGNSWTLAYGGYSGAGTITPTTDLWDGATWRTVSSWATSYKNYFFGYTGIGQSALICGGYNSGSSSITNVIRWKSDGTSSFKVWSLTSNLNYDRTTSGFFGDATSSMACAGAGSTPTTCEIWNSSSWSTTSAINTWRFTPSAFGIASAGIMAGGYNAGYLSSTEIWDGSAWSTTSATISVARGYAGQCGTTTAGLMVCGVGSGVTNRTDKWTGTAWSTTANTNTARQDPACAGTASAAVLYGGWYSSNPLSTTEIWNSTSWATTTAGCVARYRCRGAGSTTDAVVSGGNWLGTMDFDTLDSCEYWNGATWSVKSSLNVGRLLHGHVGNSVAGLVAGGQDAGNVLSLRVTEVSSDVSTIPPYYTVEGEVDITGTPALGGRTVRLYNDADGELFGSTSSHPTTGKFHFDVTDGNAKYFAIAFPSSTENYNAVIQDRISPIVNVTTWPYSGVWTVTNAMNVTRYQARLAGITSAALAAAGYTGSTVAVGTTEVWSGSSWQTVSSMSGPRYAHIAAGSVNAVIAGTGDSSGTSLSTMELWNGSAWSAGSSLSYAREYMGAVGSTASLIVFGGNNGTTGYDNTAIWNGSSWTTTCCGMMFPAGIPGGLGSTSAAISAGGRKGSDNQYPYFQTTKWDGTVWSLLSGNYYCAGWAMQMAGTTNWGLSPIAYARLRYMPSTGFWNGTSWSTTVVSNYTSGSASLAGFADEAIEANPNSYCELWRQTAPPGWGTGTWATTGSMNKARYYAGDAGNATSLGGGALCFGGYSSAPMNDTEYWSGSSWGTTSSYPQSWYGVIGIGGSSSSVLGVGGCSSAASVNSGCYLWAGSSWSSTSSIPVAKTQSHGGVGSTTSAINCKGWDGANSLNETIYWNSSSWSTTSAANQSAYLGQMTGSTSAALAIGGYNGRACIDNLEVWSGSSWATTAAFPTLIRRCGAAGTTSSCIVFGGDTSGSGSAAVLNSTFRWTGTSWTLTTRMSVGRSAGGSAGDMTSALSFGGLSTETGLTTTSEIWNFS